MSMYRQFWLAILVSMLIVFTGSLLASMLSARAYLESQLSIKNADNAAALALSLSQSNPDTVSIELAVTALFDGGHYESIRVVDPEGKTIIEKTASTNELSAPAWFVQVLPMRATPGQAEISDGWQQIGRVTLVSHSRFAYAALWRSVWQMIAALALASVVGGLLGSIILGRLKQPLQAVIDQAKAITARRFISIPEPDVPELRQLASAMNDTVGRLRNIFEEEAARLEQLRREANIDPLTGLANRTYFLARLHQAMESEDTAEGKLLLVRLADLAEINRRLGREATDDFLQQMADAIAKSAGSENQGLSARLNGADFAVLLPGERDAKTTAAIMMAKLIEAAKPFTERETVAWIAYGSFSLQTEIGSLLARVDEALATAEMQGPNIIGEATPEPGDRMPRNNAQWSQMISRALQQRWLRLGSFPVVDPSGRLLHRECPLRLLSEENGRWLPAGRFLPLAERLKLTPALDFAAAELGILELRTDLSLPGLAINLSASSIVDGDFRERLLHLLTRHPEECRRFWLEVSENGALRHLAEFNEFSRRLKATGCRIGLEHFGHQFSQIGVLHDLGLDYLKIDASFVRDLDHHQGNIAFLKGVTAIAHSIGLQVIAEGVANSSELRVLGTLDFDGATGPAIGETPALWSTE
ncbi:MAG TPA: EAL domain-containing protein [Accumulibacter sp.]|uniref:bifunctional diguanylate cyclase/phosphodiesterase n=1 Tax=Accumulibacter sp. TaxID=2053492 RepID=UPI002879FB83|nr:EAL domain-containing protein [Accumulibacter sp.]MDS4074827.1 EAL domain-containing protein [Accumulibacter sp.]HMW19097.1 EAL domain-containing protein [Accumulibacter sp.]HMX23394.1 EAL domain-containing protein [Accumulibacter sp.]HMY07055.1 EAL domain-containing protein [Accumulibacter sp.]HNC21487.1 EAL domain-containing protein [Accumulibacter sp.]